MAFNINGRVCVAFSFFWGILAIYLMSHFNPKIDKIIDNIKNKISIPTFKIIIILIILVIFIGSLFTSFALKMFFVRISLKYNIELENYDEDILTCSKLYENEKIKEFTLSHFSDERMIQAFPNIKLNTKSGDIIYARELLKDVKPYYIKVFTPKKNIEIKE